MPIKKRKSIYLPIILVFTTVFITLSMAMVELAILQHKIASNRQGKISALGVSEAGISYYLWHLAHNGTDYTDGNGNPTGNPPYGPYVHAYKDANDNTLGTYSITITPPTNGSTVTTVQSTGALSSNGQTRTVKALLGVPSFSQYAIVTSSELWFGPTENTNGPVFSNVGIHFDGVNNGIVSAANATYIPTTPFGGNGQKVENGVWGLGGPTSQWLFPVPAVDFQSITANLQQLKTIAQSNGQYLPKSSNLGYYIQFQPDGTYKLATVLTYSYNSLTTTPLVTQTIPANGVILAEDDLWVSGTVKGRYTVAAATLPSNPNTYRNITITDNTTYTTKNGNDSLGLISQGDIKIGPQSPDNMEIDGAMLSENGRVYRPCRWNDVTPCFQGNGSPKSDTYNTRSSITVYGAIGCFSYWNWSWVAGTSNNIKSGYLNTNQTYDPNMLLAPPPSFPLTGKYALLSWREVTSP